MTIRGDFKAFLAADAAIAGIVGTRVYWQQRSVKDENVTSIVFKRIDGTRDYELKGDAGYEVGVWQLELRSLSSATVEALEEAVLELLSGYSGPLSEEFQVEYSFVGDGADFQEALPNGSNLDVWGIVLFFNMRIGRTEA